MKSTFLVIAFCIAASHAHVQAQRSAALQSLIDAELAFAQTSKTKNTRDAFLQYLSDETVMFEDAKITVGKKTWQGRKPDSSLLIWEPVFADISASGDFGYTTGPFEYYASRKNGEQGFYGSYITMWKKDSASQWKMALDIGVSPQPKPASKTLNTPAISSNVKSKVRKDLKQEVMKQEMLFLKNTKKELSFFLANESRFLRPGREPVTERAEIEKIITKERGEAHYTPVDVSVSSAGDMAYVYGKLVLVIQDKQKEGFYLRIYKNTDQKDWKIVLDAIHQ
ncbi:MAG TPA: nuclear transport factor 2 family protein [Flavitalea sp.]|nr:nuclear transport factor 2 family protein [Flavitalea sp.]